MRLLVRVILLGYLALQAFAVAVYVFLVGLFTAIDLVTLDFARLRSLNWPFVLFVMTAGATHFLLVRHVCLRIGGRTGSAKPAIAAAAVNVLLAGYPLGETVLNQWDGATHLFYGGIFLANAMLFAAFAFRPAHDLILRPRRADGKGGA